MRLRSALLSVLAAVLVLAPGAAAQEEPETRPNMLVMRYFACDLGDTGEALRIMNDVWRPIWDQLEEEDLIQGYGILTHSWGDEWNVVDWVAAENMHGFHTAWSEFLRRSGEANPDPANYERFTEICRSHKDNIYQIVHAPESADGEDGS